MKKLLTIFLVTILVGVCAPMSAQNNKQGKLDKKEWLQKVKKYKHEFLTVELELNETQSKAFFEVYDAKEEECTKLERSLRKFERSLSQKINDGTATDAELDSCITLQYKFNAAMAEIDKKYESEFRKHLTKVQLFKLPRAERKFMRTLMENRQAHRSSKPNDIK